MAERVALVDLGAGNLRSVANALRVAGAERIGITADPDEVRAADRVVLPGVGAFAACMASLHAIPGMAEAMKDHALGRGRPFLGICVGMQMMAEYGVEHGTHEGMGWVAGTVTALKAGGTVKVPHMGWNDVRPVDRGTIIAPGEAYFLHSYAFDERSNPAAVVARTEHGGPVTAAIATGSALGVQFHPEKSQAYGLAFLSTFLEWKP